MFYFTCNHGLIVYVHVRVIRRSGMRQLRRDVHTSVASRRHRTLSVQRLRTLPQDERTEPTAHQTETTTGLYDQLSLFVRAARCDNATRPLCFAAVSFFSFFIQREISAVSRSIAAKLCCLIGNGCNFKN